MNKLTLVGTIIGVVLVALLVVAFAGAGPAGVDASGFYLTATPSKTPYTPSVTVTPGSGTTAVGSITVVGVGKVTVVPDVVKIQLGVETISDTLAAATAENDKVMAAVLAALEEEGVAEKDIQTSYYSIYPEYEHGEPSGVSSAPQLPKLIGYRVNNSVTVTVRDTEDMKQVSAVLEAVVQAGVNRVDGITFSVEDLQAVEDEGRKLAVADAKRRAEALADLTEVKLGPVILVSEVITGPPEFAQREVAPAAMGGGPTIMPGEQEYTVSIQITYAIQ
jgi:uncharacterized protein YggE